MGLGFLGTVFIWAAVGNCSFLTAKNNFADFGVGFTNHEDPYNAALGAKTCQEYDSEVTDLMDGAFKFAKAMGIISGVFGWILFILSSILCCVVLPPLVTRGMSIAYLVLAFASALTLVFLASNGCTNVCNLIYPGYCSSCSLKMSTGSYLAIISFIFFVGAGVANYFLKEKDANTSKGDEAIPGAMAKDEEKALPESSLSESALPEFVLPAPTIETEEEFNDDGTVTIKTTTTKTNPDGSKDIHTSVKKVKVDQLEK